MPTYNARGVGQVGVITDVPPYDLPPNAWNDAMNVRFDGTKIEKFGGNRRLMERFVKDGEQTLAIAPLRDSRTDFSWIVATDKNLYKVKSPTDIKNASKTEDAYQARLESTWYYTTLSNCLIMNTLNDVPQGIKPGQEKFQDLPNWGKVSGFDSEGKPALVQQRWSANVIRSYKNFLVCMNMYEGDTEQTEYPQRIRWSDIADVNDFPQDWDSGSTTNSAGFNDLTDATGEIIDGLHMRDSFVIYTTEDTFLMQYIGGNAIFRFTKLFTGSGLLARQCVTEFDGKHFVISQNDIYVHDGSSRKSIVAGRVREHLMREITSINPTATRVFTNYPQKEVWITYCRPGTEKRNGGDWAPNKAAVWNWEFDTWTFYELPDQTDLNLVAPLSTDTRNWEDYVPTPGTDPDPNSWAGISEFEQWEITSQNFASQYFVALGKFGTIFQLDIGERFHNDIFTEAYSGGDENKPIPITPDVFKGTEVALVAWFERRQLDFDDIGVPTWANVKVRKCYPQFTGTGSCDIQIGGSNDPKTLPTYKQTQRFTIGQNYQTSFRVNNKYLAIKFVDDQLGQWSFTGYDLDLLVGGLR